MPTDTGHFKTISQKTVYTHLGGRGNLLRVLDTRIYNIYEFIE